MSDRDAEEDKPCDVCRKPLSLHDRGAGIPICPGIYAPGYRTTLSDRIAVLESEVAALSRPGIDKAIADEREACAKVVANHSCFIDEWELRQKIAAAIRARGGHDGATY